MYVRDQRTTDEIGAHFNISGSTVQRLLREQGIRVRTRGPQNREGRIVPNIDLIEKLFLGGGLSADEVGRELGCSRHIVLRVVHDLGWPVRIGGPAPRKGPTDIELVSALYADPLVAATFRRHGIQPVGTGGSISFRFPCRCGFCAGAPGSVCRLRRLHPSPGVADRCAVDDCHSTLASTRNCHTADRRPVTFLQRWRAQNDRPSKGGPQRSTRSLLKRRRLPRLARRTR